jgi:predicted TIM-barrel enzyme
MTPLRIIGMVHLAPLDSDDACVADISRQAAAEASMLVSCGIDCVMLENNYDRTIGAKASPRVRRRLRDIAQHVVSKVESTRVGVNVRWNDYEWAIELCKHCCLGFARIPVCADDVVTRTGVDIAAPREAVCRLRDKWAPHAMLLVDAHVKHACLRRPRSLVDSIRDTVAIGADSVVLTTNSGDAPPSTHLLASIAPLCRSLSVELIVGGGVTRHSVADVAKWADAVIVGQEFRARERAWNGVPALDRKRIDAFVSTARGSGE